LAVAWSRIEVNVAKRCRGVPKKQRGKRTALTPADVIRTLEEVRRQGDPVLEMGLTLAFLTGCRRGELVGLRWDDLKPDGALECQWVTATGGDYLASLKSKGDDEVRTVHIGALGLGVFDRDVRRELLDRGPDGWLLSYGGGTIPVKSLALGLAISGVAKRVGVDATTHSFRGMSARQLIASGVDVAASASRLGTRPKSCSRATSVPANDRNPEDNSIVRGAPSTLPPPRAYSTA
jgi:integrase